MEAPHIAWVDLGPGVRAGFTTRTPGRSPAPWDGLNLGLGVGDAPARVHAQRRAVAESFGAPVLFMTQVHGTAVADADTVDVGAAVTSGSIGEADAAVTTRSDVGLGVLVADCVPVLLAAPRVGVVAVAHAGRRGLHDGVVPAVIAAMAARGAHPGDVRAVVGPCVCGACYEVPAGMCEEVAGRRPRTRTVTRAGTPALDLAAGVLGDLAATGVEATAVGVCTLEDDRYFSHRRAGRGAGVTGRFAGIVRIVSQD